MDKIDKMVNEKSVNREMLSKTMDLVISCDNSPEMVRLQFEFLFSVMTGKTDDQIREGVDYTCQLISEVDGGNRYLCLLRESIDRCFKQQYPGIL